MQAMDKYKDNKFWNRYISELYSKPVRPGSERWYVIHVEQYVKSIPDLKLVDHTSENLIQYLTLLGCKSGIKEWLFIQHIEALEILFCNVLKVNWSAQIDWDFWYASAKQLKVTHPHRLDLKDQPMIDYYDLYSYNEPAGYCCEKSFRLFLEKHINFIDSYL